MQHSKISILKVNKKRGFFRWFSALLVLVAFFASAIGFNQKAVMVTANTFQGCPTNPDALVRALVPSITEFFIFDAVSINDSIFRDVFADGEGGSSENVAIDNIPLNRNDSINVLVGATPSFGVSGQIEDVEDSHVVLTPIIASELDGDMRITEEGLAGFIVIDRSDEETIENNPPQPNWYIYEPIRPLLKSIVATRPSNCSEEDIDIVFPATIARKLEEPNSFLVGDEFGHTIVYEARNTEFTIDMDPFELKAPEAIATSPNTTANPYLVTPDSINFLSNFFQNPCADPCEVDLVFVADHKYATLKGSTVFHDMRAIINMLNFKGGNFYSSFKANIVFKKLENFVFTDQVKDFTVLGEPITGIPSPGLTFDSTPNAYQLLCDFIDSEFGDQNPANPTVFHLMTGFDLADIPFEEADKSTIDDSGDPFCDMGCGMNDASIIGLAQGIGGFDNLSINKKPCSIRPFNKIVSFENPGPFSLSQHSPKVNVEGKTSNYDATLFQRFVLVAHEIGHNLGAFHLDEGQGVKSVMSKEIDNQLNYFLSTDSVLQIDK